MCIFSLPFIYYILRPLSGPTRHRQRPYPVSLMLRDRSSLYTIYKRTDFSTHTSISGQFHQYVSAPEDLGQSLVARASKIPTRHIRPFRPDLKSLARPLTIPIRGSPPCQPGFSLVCRGRSGFSLVIAIHPPLKLGLLNRVVRATRSSSCSSSSSSTGNGDPAAGDSLAPVPDPGF